MNTYLPVTALRLQLMRLEEQNNALTEENERLRAKSYPNELFDEIEARLNTITPFPWAYRPGTPWGNDLEGNRPAAVLTTKKIEPTGIRFTPRQYGSPFIATEILSDEDAVFIARAPEDIRYLLDWVKELEEAHQAQIKEIAGLKNGLSRIKDVP